MDVPEEVGRPGAEGGPPAVAAETADVHEIRPLENLRVCPSCLVSNSAADRFCTACGLELPVATDEPERAESWPARETEPALPTLPLPAATAATPAGATSTTVLPAAESVAPSSSPERRRPTGKTLLGLVAAVVVAVAGVIVFGLLWHAQANRADRLTRTLSSTKVQLAQTQTTLAQTQAKLAATSSVSERRRNVLVEAQDVLARVDPLLSSVDNIQSKAGALGLQGGAIAYDAETFIGTVADLVNYLVHTDAAYIDGSYVSQAIDTANSELATLRADESTLSSNNSAYGAASTAFGTKADAFTHSVRLLQKQLKSAAAK